MGASDDAKTGGRSDEKKATLATKKRYVKKPRRPTGPVFVVQVIKQMVRFLCVCTVG